jgi:dTDP-4-dehydrorhamnose reductase
MSHQDTPPKVIIFGTGFVAQAYARALSYLGFYPQMASRSFWDYTKRKEVQFFLASRGFTHAINASGYTGRTVDDCETNQVESRLANYDTALMLAEECQRQCIGFIHISTGCMFMGAGPFKEEDQPNFLENVYQIDKRDAELHMPSSAWIFRIRMPFSQFHDPRNWLCKLMAYDRIIDGLNSATWIDEFAIRSWQLANKAPAGIYHAVQPDPVRTLDVARMCLYSLKAPMSEDELRRFHKTHVRRSEAVLDCSKFEGAYGAKGTPTMSAIKYCLANMGKGWNFDPNAGQSVEGRTSSIA